VMDQGQVLTPHASFDLYTTAWSQNPCEAFGGDTLQVTLKRPRWGATDFVGSDGRGQISSSHEILVDCLVDQKTQVYLGRFEWILKFKVDRPLVYGELELLSNFKDLGLVGPGT
jgi:hypothetical protein